LKCGDIISAAGKEKKPPPRDIAEEAFVALPATLHGQEYYSYSNRFDLSNGFLCCSITG
jgi:hypothetical protein